jgi:predicted P-loop ATPase
MNIGVRLGEASKLECGNYLGVLDLDIKNPKAKSDGLSALGDFLAKKNVSFGPVVISGRGNGSCHVYIKTKKEFDQVRVAASSKLMTIEGKKPTPEWDIVAYSKGRQVVLPPSIHPDTGAKYYWDKTLSEKIPLIDLGGMATEKQKKEVLKDWEPVAVDLVNSTLSEDIYLAITKGVGVEDRSASLYGVSIAMQRAGFKEREILSVLTDKKYFLGEVGFDHAKTNSRARAANWVLNHTVRKAKTAASSRDDFEVVDSGEVDELPDPVEANAIVTDLLKTRDWRLKLTKTDKGVLHTSFHNLMLILTNAANGPLLKHNSFNVQDTWMVDCPWGAKKGEEVVDDDILMIKAHLVKRYRFEPKTDKITEVVRVIARQNSFHPVKDYLATLVWDGIPRLETWLKDYHGATGPQAYLAAVGRKVLTAMIARVMNPGCKFDHVMVLEGKQGIGKSTMTEILSYPWYSDTAIDIREKDSKMQLQGVWILELAELNPSKKDRDLLKNFITSKSDRFRLPYGRKMATFKRQSVFIGTTNDSNYLSDKTGGRRWWPVKAGQLDRDGLIKVRDQLIAEAKVCYERNEKLWLDDPHVEKLAKVEQRDRLEIDDVQDELENFLDKKTPAPFRIIDLLSEPFFEGMRKDQWSQNRVGEMLRTLGYKMQYKRVNKVKARWWEKEGKNEVENDAGL